MSLIERLKNPEDHYKFSDPKKANAVLMSLCQEAADALAAPVQEPVAYQQRTRPNWMDETCWTPWEDCSKSEAEDCWNRPRVHDWLYEARALYTTPPAQPAPECTRSHPHENMDAMCELRTEIARLTNENARLKAQPAPASWMETVTANLVREGVNKHKARELAEHFYSLAQPAPVVQEPVAWKWHQAPVKTSWGHVMVVADLAIDKDNTVSVYCERDQTAKVEAMFTPPAAQRQFVGLTDEDFICLCEEASNFGTGGLIRHIEAKLKEKND